MSAAVVVLNWNKAEETRHCILAARLATTAPAQWIVVDNGSTEPIGDLGPDVTVLRNATNLGFAGGVNTGLRHAFAAGAEHVWLLNNDAEPLPGALDTLLAAARADPRIGLASPVILRSDIPGAFEHYGGTWKDGTYDTAIDPAVYAAWLAAAPERIWLVGTALLVSRTLIETIGYFDEDFFAYWEDNDISRRSAAAGFRNVVVPEAAVRHQHASRAERPEERPPYWYYFISRNELLLVRKTGDGARALYWSLLRSARLYMSVIALPSRRRAVRLGVLHGLLRRGGPYRD